jgi:hypothetical protein
MLIQLAEFRQALLDKAKALARDKDKPEMLRLPPTLPDDASVFQTVSVIDDCNNDCEIHVELADIMDCAESWGMYLADVARAIARDSRNSDWPCTDREDGDVFKAICHGFLHSITKEKRLSVAASYPWDKAE